MKQIVPARRSPKEAVAFLHEWAELTPEKACDFLNNMLDAAHMLMLYEHFFPDQYAASKANDRQSTSLSFAAYTDKEQEFLRLLEKRLPINEFYLEAENERFDCIPLGVAGIDCEDVENCHTAIAVIYTLYQGEEGLVETDKFWGRVKVELPPGAELPLFRQAGGGPYGFNPKKFTRLLRKTFPASIRPGLRWLVRLVCYNTGNAFLDTPAEMLGNSELPTWSVRELRWLMAEWTREERIYKEIDRARVWLEADHCRGLADFIAIWNRCSTPIPAEPAAMPAASEQHERTNT